MSLPKPKPKPLPPEAPSEDEDEDSGFEECAQGRSKDLTRALLVQAEVVSASLEDQEVAALMQALSDRLQIREEQHRSQARRLREAHERDAFLEELAAKDARVKGWETRRRKSHQRQ